MARSSTTLDPFSALAEPKRREVLATLARGELPVNAIVEQLGWPQPQVSKHLAVLRDVGIVAVARRGRERVYSVNGDKLKTIHDWIKMYEHFWDHQLTSIKQRAEAMARAAAQPHTAYPPSADPASGPFPGTLPSPPRNQEL